MSDVLTGMTFCWRLERRDGAGLALTSHDRPIEHQGVRYEPSPGMTPAAIRSQLGLDPASSEIAGTLSSRAISEEDLAAGRWDGAALKLVALDWTDPGAPAVDLLEGELGEVDRRDGGFSADLLGAASRLDRPICPTTSPLCRAELGDGACRVDMAGRRLLARAMACQGNLVTVDAAIDDRFRFGELRVLAGPANGEWRTILSVDGQHVGLRSALSKELAAGTPVELREGCDKRLETCAGRFANAVNFRGEPHLPGNDLLTRYPGA